ncbi:MAG: cupin-like domain-containing protein, partial [Planctomycetota bacterium]
ERTANLLISSPTAWVPYHVDMPVNMLWHIRGKKRVWVYPHFDKRFASSEVLEKVCSGEWSEDVPYDTSFDRYALIYDAEPGQLITWPQLTPHRVRNLEGLNVSLSTEHKNARARRRINVHTGNHLLRNRFGVVCREIAVDGAAAHGKQALARAFRLAGKFIGKQKEQFVYPKTFVVDPEAPHGYRLIDDVGAGVVAPHTELEPVVA